ncbi:hypothetical protein [Candidatus Roseilinea sp. NK_OTU-006]|uniref:hypothetical protein n=1 Tax=Candidatus Roseilinea sp. NK_OTU-006 TaxID=2704250 RepID=UPI00145D5DD1|nr:hypothetical protein [Candidatus Roseilinea sp. NK_OTU-006]
MSRSILIVLPGILLSACSFTINPPPPAEPALPPGTPVPAQSTPLSSGAAALPTTTIALEPTAAPSSAALPTPNVTCNEIALYLESSLGSAFSCDTEAASEGPDVHPEHTLLTLEGYPLSSDALDQPVVHVFPLAAYQSLSEAATERLNTLQNLLASESVPVYAFGASLESLPFLPLYNAGQVFYAQYQKLPFQNGKGIRYLTAFAQDVFPVSNSQLLYTYQGITQDGKYWVAVILPVKHPLLPDDVAAENLPGGLSWEQFEANYPAYINQIAAMLNAQPANSFVPSLEALDSLVTRMQIAP